MSVQRVWRETLEALCSLFFPRHCAGCRTVLEEGWFCQTCREGICEVGEPRCEVCSHPFEGTMERFVCANCQGRGFHFECAVAVYRSRGVLRELIHRLKYGGETWLQEPLGELLVRGMDDKRLKGRDLDGIVAVPLHPVRQRERQFNQSELLGQALARRQKLPLLSPLKRTRNTVTQTHFDRRKRMQNLRDAFKLSQNATVQGRNLLLVDDVFTTGSTLDECSRVLLDAGARTVCALTLARG